jgi:hypothetical protein
MPIGVFMPTGVLVPTGVFMPTGALVPIGVFMPTGALLQFRSRTVLPGRLFATRLSGFLKVIAPLIYIGPGTKATFLFMRVRIIQVRKVRSGFP